MAERVLAGFSRLIEDSLLFLPADLVQAKSTIFPWPVCWEDRGDCRGEAYLKYIDGEDVMQMAWLFWFGVDWYPR